MLQSSVSKRFRVSQTFVPPFWPSQSLHESHICVFVRLLTLLASQQPLDALDEFVSVTVSVDADLLQLLVAHVRQHVQRNLPGNNNNNNNKKLNVLLHKRQQRRRFKGDQGRHKHS